MYDQETDDNTMKLEDVPWKYSLTGGGWKDKQLADLAAKISHIQAMLENGGTKTKCRRALTPEEIESKRQQDTNRILTAKELECSQILVHTNFTDSTRKQKEGELQGLLQQQMERKQETLTVQPCRRPY